MDKINVINAKLNEINYKIRRERKNIKLTRKQCEQMSKTLATTKTNK